MKDVNTPIVLAQYVFRSLYQLECKNKVKGYKIARSSGRPFSRSVNNDELGQGLENAL